MSATFYIWCLRIFYHVLASKMSAKLTTHPDMEHFCIILIYKPIVLLLSINSLNFCSNLMVATSFFINILPHNNLIVLYHFYFYIINYWCYRNLLKIPRHYLSIEELAIVIAVAIYEEFGVSLDGLALRMQLARNIWYVVVNDYDGAFLFFVDINAVTGEVSRLVDVRGVVAPF